MNKLTLYRLHTSACTQQYKRHHRENIDCRCFIYAEGQFFGELVICSMRTRVMKTAQHHVNRCERLKMGTTASS